MVRRSAPRVGVSVLLAGAMAVPAGLSTATADTSCTDTTWNGSVGDGAWTNPSNWTNGVPDATHSATVAAPANATTTIVGVGGQVCGLSLSGGSSASTRLSLSLASGVTSGNLSTSGFVRLAPADETAAPVSLDASGTVTMATGTNLTLVDDHINLVARGPMSLQDGVAVRGEQTGSAFPHITVMGSLTLQPASATPAGDTVTAIDLDLASAATVDAGSSVLGVVGPSVSHWSAGAAIVTGKVSVGSAATVTVDHLTVHSPSVLTLSGTSTVDGGSGGTIDGDGTLDWQAGSVQGFLTLQLPTRLSGGGSRFVLAGAELSNRGVFAMTDNGYLRADGDIDNLGTMVFRPGGSVLKIAPNTSTFHNALGATLAVEPHDASQPAFPSDQVLFYGVTLSNNGAIDLPVNERLVLDAGTSSVLDNGGSLTGGGILEVGNATTLTVAGTTTIPQNAGLLLDDQDDGSKARIVGGNLHYATGSFVGTLKSDGTTQGSFRWASGTITGGIELHHLASYVLSASSTSHRQLGDGTTATTLRLDGPSLLSDTTVIVMPKAGVAIDGSLVLSGTSVGIDAGSGQSDQSVTVDANGTLTVTQVAASGTRGPQPSTATIAPTFVNHGAVSVDGSTLVTTLGYTQQSQPGAPANTAVVTGLANGATLQAGATGDLRPLAIATGGFGGVGTVIGSRLTIGKAWLHPGYTTTAGKLTVQAPLTLTSKSETRIVVRPPAAGGVVPQHDVLALTQPATLSGQLSTSTDTGGSKWKPTYLSTVPGVVTTTTRTGGYTAVAWGGTPPGLGWRPYYGASRIDVRLVDVAPPVPTRIAVSAFTENPTPGFAFAAVDPYPKTNTGVADYDVRWRSGTSQKAFGAWHYPKAWQHTKKTNLTAPPIAEGSTWCLSIRIRDRQGNQSAWTTPACAGRMLDDSRLSASTGWTRRSNVAGVYGHTVSSTTLRGASLRWRGTFRRVAVAAYRCPTCGTVDIYAGSHLLKRWNLASSHSGMVSWISRSMPSRLATVRLVNHTSGRLLLVDAVGLAR